MSDVDNRLQQHKQKNQRRYLGFVSLPSMVRAGNNNDMNAVYCGYRLKEPDLTIGVGDLVMVEVKA